MPESKVNQIIDYIKNILETNNEHDLKYNFDGNIQSTQYYVKDWDYDDYSDDEHGWCNESYYGGHKEERNESIPSGYLKQIVTVRYGLLKLNKTNFNTFIEKVLKENGNQYYNDWGRL